MRRIYPLRRGRTFEEVAQALADTELDLARVVSCTFPGRPEPKNAEWRLPSGVPVLAYVYIPDIELRYVHVLSPDFSVFADGGPDGDGFEVFFDAQIGEEVFDDFATLRGELHVGDHAPSCRAAAAFRVAVQAGDDTVDGESELVEAIAEAGGRGPIAASAELEEVATRRFLERIEELYAQAVGVELRMHLKRARDRAF